MEAGGGNSWPSGSLARTTMLPGSWPRMTTLETWCSAWTCFRRSTTLASLSWKLGDSKLWNGSSIFRKTVHPALASLIRLAHIIFSQFHSIVAHNSPRFMWVVTLEICNSFNPRPTKKTCILKNTATSRGSKVKIRAFSLIFAGSVFCSTSFFSWDRGGIEENR